MDIPPDSKRIIPPPRLESRFESCELCGGPHPGQSVHLPTDQDEVVFYDEGHPHRYHRLSPGLILHHEAKIEAVFGGKR